jgi:Pentapeptide repeats (8 copies)
MNSSFLRFLLRDFGGILVLLAATHSVLLAAEDKPACEKIVQLRLGCARQAKIAIWDAKFVWVRVRTSASGPSYERHTGTELLDLLRDSRTVDLRDTMFINPIFGDAQFINVDFSRADLHCADMSLFSPTYAIFTGANLVGTDLSNANLSGVRLNGANLTGANLTHTALAGADLTGTVFEPSCLPEPGSFAAAENLDRVTFATDSSALSQMRQKLQDTGFVRQERQIIYAIRRREGERIYHDARPPNQTEQSMIRIRALKPWTPSIRGLMLYYADRIAFERTCGYGLYPFRPLLLIAIAGALWSTLYWLLMHTQGRSGLSMKVTRISSPSGTVRTHKRMLRGDFGRLFQAKSYSSLHALGEVFGKEWSLLCAASYFSLLTAFGMSFREWDPGKWIRLLPLREYELAPVYWMRPLAGVQSLLSLYLLVLSVLTFFGRPFA